MSTASKSHLLHAFRKVMRPLIKILIRAGVRLDEFIELSKGVYVESAVRDGIGDITRPTRTRVSLATGVPLRDVQYFVDNDGALPTVSKTLAAILVEVLQKWHTEPQYVGPYGIPLELELDSPDGGRCLAELIDMVDPTANPNIVVEELVRVGSVTYSGEKHFRALSRYFLMPEPMSAEQLEYFGNVLTRLADTLEFNMNPSNDKKRLERFVVADRGLPADDIQKFEIYVRERVNELLLEIDDWLSPFSSKGLDEAGVRINTGLNVFMYLDVEPDKTPLNKLVEDVTDEIPPPRVIR